MMDDFDALIGTPEPKRRGPGRPTNEERAARQAELMKSAAHRAEIMAAAGGTTKVAFDEFRMPVNRNWLARLFNMDSMTVRKRLENCPVAGTGRANNPVYYFHDAVQYLVKPKMTAEQFARTLNKADLPPEINKSFWDSQRSRVKYKIEAQEAWETEDVLAILGEVAMIFKDATTMVVEEMRNRAKLTDAQTEILAACIDELRTDIRKRLVDMPNHTRRGSMYEKPMFGVSEEPDRADVPEGGWLDDDAEDDA